MKSFKSHFVFNRNQQNGIFLLVVIIIVLQLFYFYRSNASSDVQELDNEELIHFQQKIDSIRLASGVKDTVRIFPFNPNFITDYRGYVLGMSIEEIDRLHQYREAGKWVNSDKEFQQVTGVSDSLLAAITPYFRFPDWVNSASTATVASSKPIVNSQANIAGKEDLNLATTQELMEVRGIGETLAGRIVNYRNKIGGFVSDIQLKDIYGLNFETRAEVEKRFTVKTRPEVIKLNINTASVLELSTVPYIDYELAREIVNYRLLHEEISNFTELAKIKEFPSEKIDRIALYLTLE